MNSYRASIGNIEREIHHRFIETDPANELISTGFHMGLPELQTRKVDATQPEYSISYILQGEGEFTDNHDNVFPFSPGCIVQRYPGMPYSIHRPKSFTHLEFFLILPRSLFESFTKTGIIQNQYSVFDAGIDSVFINKLSTFVHQFTTSTNNDTRFILMETIALIIDCFKRDRSLLHDSEDRRLIEQACLLLSDGFEEKLKLEAVADKLGLSYESFRKKFRAYKNISPAQYRIQKRIEQAMTLLIEDSIPIKEIAFNLGYSNVANFAKVFQKATGAPPATFRSEHRKRIERNA
ncbi:MAG: AraC family transcriptional regulator [Opitutaceae bacterium]|nr:AraC family transcriptional regulator [Opitutaceae bacterium]